MAIKQQNLNMYDFYVAFVQFYQNNQIKKLSEQGKIQDEENFRKELNLFQQALALDMKQNQLALVNYQKKGKLRLDEDNSEVDNNDSWMNKYFGDSSERNDKKLLRNGSLLNQKGNTFSFMHKSIQEYFVSLYLIDFLDFLPKIDFDQVSELFDKLIAQIKSNGKKKFNSLNALTENINLNFKQEIDNLPNLIQFIKIIGKSKFSKLNFSLQSYYGIQKFIIHEIRMKKQSEVKLLLITRLSSLIFDFLRISSNALYLFTQIYGVINQINLELIEIEGINLQGCSFYKVNLNETQFQNVNISQCAYNASQMLSVNWNQLICSEQSKFDGHENLVFSLVFSPDGKILISGSYDKTIRQWDANKECQLLRLEPNYGVFLGLAFSQDGKLWASAHDQDGVVILWKINQTVPVKEFSQHNGKVICVAFSHDSKILASGGLDIGSRKILN